MDSTLLGTRVRGTRLAVLLAGLLLTALVAAPAQAGGPVPFGGTVEPAVKIQSGPEKKTTSKRATFKFIADESPVTYTCELDHGATEPCTSPQSYRKLKVGLHRFTVFATDDAGNRSVGDDYAWRIKKEL